VSALYFSPKPPKSCTEHEKCTLNTLDLWLFEALDGRRMIKGSSWTAKGRTKATKRLASFDGLILSLPPNVENLCPEPPTKSADYCRNRIQVHNWMAKIALLPYATKLCSGCIECLNVGVESLMEPPPAIVVVGWRAALRIRDSIGGMEWTH
jgi:hypothetical protein